MNLALAYACSGAVAPSRLLLCLCVLALSGCAADSTYQEAQGLLAKSRPLEALVKLEDAMRANPQSAEYRLAWLKTRGNIVGELLVQAQQHRSLGRFDEADDLYRRILQVDAANEAAVLGLKSTERERVWAGILDQVGTDLEQRNFESARGRLRSVLAESPRHLRALQMQQRLGNHGARTEPEAALNAAYRKSLSLEFKEATIKTAFEIIAKTSGMNFVFDKDVRTEQKVTIFLRNTTVESAVSRILITNQLAQRVLDANTVLIYPDTAAKQKDYQLLTVRSFYLSSADAKTVATTLKSLLRIKDVVVDERLNLLMVRDSPDAIRLVERVVALQDLPEPEVMLEVEVLEVKRSVLLDLGVRWPSQLSLNPLASGSGAQLTLGDLRNLRSDTIGASVSSMSIAAREGTSSTNILANPRIRAKNREKAKILIGDRVPNITTTSNVTGFVADSVTYIDVGLKLEVEPSVSPDNEISIKLAMEVSNLVNQVQTKSGTLAYQIGTRNASTVLRLRDGENQILAGLINDEDRRSADKIPWLGSAPLLGRLFGTTNDDAVKTEIVLSITPRLLRNVQRPDSKLLEFESGTDSSLRVRAEASSVDGLPDGTASNPALPQVNRGTATATPPSVSQPPANRGQSDIELTWGTLEPIAAGQVFKVALTIEARKALAVLPMAISFDPAVIEVLEVSESGFLSQDGGAAVVDSRIDASGQVLLTVRRTGPGGAIGSGGSMPFRVELDFTPDAL